MAGRDLKLQVVFAALDKITGPLKKIMGGSSETAKALKATSDRLRDLNAQQKNISKFRELHGGLDATRTKLEAAQQKVASLATKMKQTEAPTRAMTREFNAATKAASALKTAGQQQAQQLQVMRERLAGAGIGTKDLANHERTLRREIEATNKTTTLQQQKLANAAAKQQRVSNATQHADKLRNKAGNLAMAGAGATATGAVIGAPVVKGLNEAKHYQTEVGRVNALGLGDKVSGEAVAFARNMKTYGTSQLDNLQLMRDGMSAFADVHHAEMVAPTLAKMKFANHAFFGEEEGADNERKFMDMLKVIELRGGLESKEKFEAQANIVQQVITATGGRVGPNEWLNMIKTGGIAAKGLKDDAFYYQMEPLVQEMSGNRVGTSLMSAYQNLYQGRTTKRSVKKLDEFGLIGDKSKVTPDKAGQIAFLDPGALLGSELFRENQFEWLEKVLLPQLAKKGITEKKHVLDAIGSIFSNRTASNLYSQMYLQRVQIHKNEKLNRGAADIGRLEKLGRDSAAGKELEAQSKLANLKLTMGEKILPLYAQGLELAISAVQRLNGFMERNPTVAKLMITAFAVLAGLLLVLGPLMLGIAAMIGPYAMLHVMFAKMGVTGGVLTPILRKLGGAFMWAGRAVLWLGRALLMNPIGIAITVIAGAAFLIYKYWEPIKAFFGGLWSDVKAAFAGGFTGINSLIADWSPLGLFYRAFAGVLGWFGIALPARFTDFAASIRGRFAKGLAPLASFFTGIWSQIKTAFAGGIGGVSALIANWSPLGLFYRAFAGVLGWFGIALPTKFTDFGATILQRITASWAPISAFFVDIWSRLRTVCAGGMGSITALIINWSPVGVFYQAFAGVMSWFGIKLPAQFTEFGANILRGLVNGITGSMGAVKDAISNAGSSTIAWFKEKLGIHSPSRVFAQLGDYTMQGLAVGLDRSEGEPIAKVSSMAQRLTQLGAGIAIGTATALPASAFDTRAPLAQGGFGAGLSIQGDKIEITIQAQAGSDPQAIARAVYAAMEQRDREKAARIRSSLRDHD
ncbi:phage tail protein [Janthinobacterium sp. FW305-129]|uniref:phage tail protein n=1 Tax=Janthinobacterium sp. FW305-129 TaxID=2775054 RepID=UPI001E3CDC3C|nr:phage tail protein [Janthinobacterium sp. FW305-129]MCC7596740.1 phage tail protein [Janthinobacterium sp. FW305-129]